MPNGETSLEALVARAERLRDFPGRAVLGLAGPPGAGKQALADHLARALSVPGAVVARVALQAFVRQEPEAGASGWSSRLGAPETFDVDAYAQFLEAVRQDPTSELAGPDGTLVPGGAGLVVTDGSYLLLGVGDWAAARRAMDEVWWIEVPEELQRRRLLTRAERSLGSGTEAERRVADVEMVNSDLVRTFQTPASLLVGLADGVLDVT